MIVVTSEQQNEVERDLKALKIPISSKREVKAIAQVVFLMKNDRRAAIFKDIQAGKKVDHIEEKAYRVLGWRQYFKKTNERQLTKMQNKSQNKGKDFGIG